MIPTISGQISHTSARLSRSNSSGPGSVPPNESTGLHLRYKRIAIYSIVVTALIILGTISNPAPVDLVDTFLPAARAILAGASPYTIPTYVSPPWVAVAFIPLTLLPDALAAGVLFAANVLSLGYVARKFGAGRVSLVALFVSLPVLNLIHFGNIDGVVALGFVAPYPIAFILLLFKPQIGIVFVAFSIYRYWYTWIEMYDTGRENIMIPFYRNFILPVGMIVLLSFILWGFWLPKMFRVTAFDAAFNASLFPALIPAGLVLAVAAFRKRDVRYAIGASPCLSPHLTLQSWAIAGLALVHDAWLSVAACVGVWVIVIVRMIGG